GRHLKALHPGLGKTGYVGQAGQALKRPDGSVMTGGGASSPSQQLADDLSRHVYELARLAVGGLEPNELAGFQQRSATLMGQLMQRGL
ncbi:MAG: hypothetical protein VKM92_07475, partial [Cyanobacteriota bacterium]|nr:hypothetical protein [Cyanobacteriota bacterium]